MSKCPKCGSENISVQIVTTDMKTKKYGNGLGGKAHNYVTALGTWLADIGVIVPSDASNKTREVLISSLEEFDKLAGK